MEYTKRGKSVYNLSRKVVAWLKPYCRRIEVVGSIRRKQPNPKDIDIVLIPKSHSAKEKLEKLLENEGKKILGGEKKAYFHVDGIEVELYYAVPEEWSAALLAYSSRRGSGIGLRIVARLKGYKLSQHGLFSRKTGRRIAGRTEEGIYHVLGRSWKPPKKR